MITGRGLDGSVELVVGPFAGGGEEGFLGVEGWFTGGVGIDEERLTVMEVVVGGPGLLLFLGATRRRPRSRPSRSRGSRR